MESGSITMAVWYNIAAMRHLGEPGSPPQNSRKVCEAAGTPRHFTRQSFTKLCHAGLLTAEVGLRDGFTLAKCRCNISLADVVAAIDGPPAMSLDETLQLLTPASVRRLKSLAKGHASNMKRRLAAVRLSDLA